jgi:SAM-dependent methyltransferase
MSAPATDLAAHFETLYAASSDPWNVRDAWYEQRKRGLLLAALPERRYASAFEPGCGNGELTASLALRCERILACDGSASAIAAARERVAAHPGVRAEQRRLPQDWPEGDAAFDLIVVSEMAYYLPADDWRAMIRRIVASLAPGGLLMMCHCRYPYDDYATSADFVHSVAHATPELAARVHCMETDFLLDGWLRAG